MTIRVESAFCHAATEDEGGTARKRTSGRAGEVDRRDGPTNRSTDKKVCVFVVVVVVVGFVVARGDESGTWAEAGDGLTER